MAQSRSDVFDGHKAIVLAELAEMGSAEYSDKSPKGSVDAAVVDLVKDINASRDFVTTSSCSGRVSLFYEGEQSSSDKSDSEANADVQSQDLQISRQNDAVQLQIDDAEEINARQQQAPRKGQGRWLGVNHDRALSSQEVLEMLSSVENLGGTAVLKHEPFVLHVQCRDEISAQALLRVAMESGMRESGISLGQKKVMVGIRTLSNVLEVPLLVDGKSLMPEPAVEAMCQIAAEKFRINCEKRAAFHSNIRKFLKEYQASPQPQKPRAAPARGKTKKQLQQQQQQQSEATTGTSNDSSNTVEHCLDWKELSQGADLLQRWGQASVPLPDGSAAIAFGGFGPCDGTSHERRNDVLSVVRQPSGDFVCSRVEPSGEPPSARIKHSACWLDAQTSMCVFGGRQSPHNALSDVALLRVDSPSSCSWTNLQISGEQVSGRWGHSMVGFSQNGGLSQAIVFGGRSADSVFNDVVCITISEDTQTTAHIETWLCSGTAPAPRYGHTAVLMGANQDQMVVYGGYATVGKQEAEAEASQNMLGGVHILSLSTRTWTTVCPHSPQMSRFSHGAVALDQTRMLVVGGVSIDYRNNGAKVFDLDTLRWTVVRSSEEYGSAWAPKAMHQKFSLVALPRGNNCVDVLALGGGNLCFSFGFCFGKSSYADASWLLSHSFVEDAIAVSASDAKTVKVCLEKNKLYDRSRKIVPYLHNGRTSVLAVPFMASEASQVKALVASTPSLQAVVRGIVHCPPPALAGAAPDASPGTKFTAQERVAEAKAKQHHKAGKTLTGPGIAVPAASCKICKSTLEQAGLYDKTRRVGKLENGLMGVPVRGNIEQAIAALASVGVIPDSSTESMELPKTPIPKQQTAMKKSRNVQAGSSSSASAVKSSTGSKGGKINSSTGAKGNNGGRAIKDQLRVWLEGLVTRTPALQLPSNEIMRSELPGRIELLGDVAIVPREAFRSESAWQPIFDAGKSQPEDCLWAMIAALTSAKRVLRQQKIDIGVKRQSRATMVYPRNNPDTIVTVKQNGVLYSFDMEKCMFSSGNISEKQRVAKFPCDKEVVVDMFAGIGYFTLPYLVKANAVHLHACEWNSDALAALRNNLQLNGVERRCTVYAGDCRVSVEQSLQGVADRVNLGLIPSSRPFWSTAMKALNQQSGGWLHIHENVARKERDEFVKEMIETLRQWAPEEWVITCNHVERVKSYSPHVDHIVADVFCGPKDDARANATSFSATLSKNAVPGVLRAPQPGDNEPLPVVKMPYPRTQKEMEAIFALDKPVVLENVPSFNSSFWSLQNLKEFCKSHSNTGEQKVSVHVADDPHLSFVRKSFRFEVTNLQDLIQQVSQAGAPATYLRAVGPNARKERAHFWKDFAELATASGLEFPHLFVEDKAGSETSQQNKPPSRYFSSVFRISTPGLQLWTHYDVMANVLYQLHGSKRVVIFRPEDVGKLDMRGPTSAVVDIDNQAPGSPFACARARAMEVHLEAGQALYMPALWPHNACAKDEPSVAVNVFWRSLAPHFYGAKDLYGNRDPLRVEEALSLVQRAGDILQAAEDDGSVLPKSFQQFYAEMAAASLTRPFSSS